MSRLPTPGSDDGTWGNVLNDFLGQEHNADGTQKTLPLTKGGTGATSAAAALSSLGGITDAMAQAKVDAHATSAAPHSSSGDLTFAADSDANGAGDIILKTGNVERARIAADGTGSGLLNGGSLSATPEQYGAVGDGVTDDTTALQTWIASGANLALTPGKTYLHRQMLSMAASGQTLNGNGATLKRAAQTSATTATAIASGVTNQITLTGGG